MTPEPCPLCNGEGWVPSATPDPRQARLQAPGRPPMEPCACVRARARQQRLIHAGIPKEYQACTFDNFRAYTPALIDALHLARGYADRYPAMTFQQRDPAGLLLIGQTGVGKTHLAAALLTTIISGTGIHGLFYTTRELLRRMRDSYNPAIQTTEHQVLDPILTCDLLVLDDLGAERLTDWVADTMDLIIDTRYSAGRPVIVTTNFPDVDDDEEVNGLGARVGFRTRSRLHKMCRFVTLDGADYRHVRPDTPEDALEKLARQRPFVAPTRALRGPRPSAKDGKADLKWPGGKGGNT